MPENPRNLDFAISLKALKDDGFTTCSALAPYFEMLMLTNLAISLNS